ncbi:hypothetical protein CPB86DRAFT_872127 [Serendipita vermifera]|nr:hypothetical protein CPB86DRAFT_872127 [Serendipita vermifera]
MEGNFTTALRHFIRDDQAGSDPSGVEMIQFLAGNTYTGKRLALATLTWVTYEIIITLDQSVKLFWQQKWTLSKVFFLLNQFAAVYTLAINALRDPSSLTLCKVSPWLQFVGTLILLGVLTLSMGLRVRALWIRSRFVVTITMALFAINMLTFVITISYGQATATVEPAPFPLTGCVFKATFRHPYIFTITTIAFESLVIVLVFLKSKPTQNRQTIRLPLSALLLQDGLVYYLAIVSVQLLVLIAMFVADFSVVMTLLASLINLAVAGVACNRMFMRLQHALLSKRVMVLGSAGRVANVSTSVWVDTGAVSTEIEGDRKYDLDRRRDRIQRQTFPTFPSDVETAELKTRTYTQTGL